MKEQVIEIIISELDFYLIEKVREYRIKADPYISQTALSIALGVSEGFVSKVENPKERAKYNIRHLNKLPKIFKFTSFTGVLPASPVKNDIVRIRLELKKRKKGKQTIEDSKPYKIIFIKPLKEDEMQKWSNNELPYLTIVK